MFAIVTCPECRNDRMVDLSTGTSTCPFCGRRFDTDRLAVKFKHSDQNIVRDVLTGNENVPTTEDAATNPMKKLSYNVAHCNDPGMRMRMIVDGLDEIVGEFTIDDIDALVPGKGERYASAMLEACLIYELGYGKFKKI